MLPFLEQGGNAMTIREAISLIDEHKPNTFSQGAKIRWLNQLDCGIFTDIISTHEGGPESFPGYHEDTDIETVLLADQAHEQMYLHWLEAKVDYANGEYNKYNNAIAMFNADYEEYQKAYNRSHMPLGNTIRYW